MEKWKIITVIQMIMEFADFIADWLFTLDVYFLESGLVYGRHEDKVKIPLFVFAGIGTFTFFTEMIISIIECRSREKPFKYHCVVTAFILWLEDFPQAVLSIVIAACREDGSSRFQLAKAGIAIALALLQFTLATIECCQQRKKSGKMDTLKKCVLAFTFIGVIFNFAACVTVFFLSHTHIQGNGSLSIREPTSEFEERYDDRYFFNVSAYLYDPSFQSDVNNNVNNVRMMKVTSIDSVRGDSQKWQSVAFQYKYQDSPSQLRFALWSNASGPAAPWECYTLNKGNRSITAVSNCTSSFLQGNVTGLSIQMVFKPPESVAVYFRKTIYGDIVFGVKRWEQGQCRPFTQFQNTLPSNALHRQPALHYFRSLESSGSSRHLVEDSGTLRFYTMADLTDVASIWRTGWTKCSATGHVAPQLDTDLDVQC